jgi:hypothetical protein
MQGHLWWLGGGGGVCQAGGRELSELLQAAILHLLDLQIFEQSCIEMDQLDVVSSHPDPVV